MSRLAVLVLCVPLAAGCGGSSSSSKGKPAPITPTVHAEGTAMTTLHLETAPSARPRFNVIVLKAPAGKVQLVLTNSSNALHNIAVSGHGVDVKGKPVRNGGTSSVNVDLKPGQYEFYSSVDGDRAKGMHGLLNVGTASSPGNP